MAERQYDVKSHNKVSNLTFQGVQLVRMELVITMLTNIKFIQLMGELILLNDYQSITI